ncbi:MAG: hypothetical protein ABI427_08135 [Solirubrobacteraceae bacterium]
MPDGDQERPDPAKLGDRGAELPIGRAAIVVGGKAGWGRGDLLGGLLHVGPSERPGIVPRWVERH